MNTPDRNIKLERNDRSITIKVSYFSLQHIIGFGMAAFSSMAMTIFVLFIEPRDSLVFNFGIIPIAIFLSAFGFYALLQRLINYRKLVINKKEIIVTIEPINFMGTSPVTIPIEEITGFYFIFRSSERSCSWELYADLREGMYTDLIEFEKENHVRYVIDELHKFLNIESKEIKREENKGQRISYRL